MSPAGARPCSSASARGSPKPSPGPLTTPLVSFCRSLEGLEIPNIHNLTFQKLTNLSHM